MRYRPPACLRSVSFHIARVLVLAAELQLFTFRQTPEIIAIFTRSSMAHMLILIVLNVNASRLGLRR